MAEQEKVHYLKTWPEYYQACKQGEKPFEIRNADRLYEVGDILHLEEWNPTTKEYTGDASDYRVIYCLRVEPFVPAGYVAMGIVPVVDKYQECRDRKLLREIIETLAETGGGLCPTGVTGLKLLYGEDCSKTLSDCYKCWRYAKEQWEKRGEANDQ